MENAKKFFEEVIKTDEAKAILADTKQPETDEERAEAEAGLRRTLLRKQRKQECF